MAGLSGYQLGYSGSDHHVGTLDVRLDTSLNANVVTVTGTIGVRDWSGTWDDDYEGTIEFVVLADLESPTAPPPRTDLLITGMEFTQCIQFFRSSQFLDLTNVRPDNSIRLVARKTTGVRVYVDYDRAAGLPPISSLSGELEVTTSIGSTTFTLAPTASIQPRRDAQIDRRQSNQTLNFVIPEAWCQGQLNLRCRVFDAASPAEKSPATEQTISFTGVAPLRLFGVAVHYTGQGLDLAAPSQAQVVSTMTFVEKTYPVGEVLLTGYSAIDFGTDLNANISDGCGRGFNALLDRLRDMRGSSTDVYYGILPSGINSGSVGGCGGGGVGAGFVGDGMTAAQEIGHAFDRDHAPCDSSARCDDPAHQDGNYPHYDGFPSDSIGEIGYDAATDSAKDPAGTFDFMGYSGPVWVSPYTYTGLMGQFPASSGIGSAASAMSMLRAAHEGAAIVGGGFRDPGGRAEWIRKESELLFLGLSVARDRTVRRRASFHYPALWTWPRGEATGFTVELHDGAGRVLVCQTLHEECRHCTGNCWPKRFRDVVSMPPGAKTLVVWEGRDRLYEEDIPDPPEVEVECRYLEKEQAHEVKWSAADGQGDGEEADLWYLVQWQDLDGSWRGVAPRTRERTMRIPVSLVGWRASVPVRVLATSGIATGVGECTLEGPDDVPPPCDVVVMTDPTVEVHLGVITVALVESGGRTVPDPEVHWYNESGAEIGRGRTLDLGPLREGEQIVRAVVPDRGGGVSQKMLLVDRGADGTCLRCEEVPTVAAPGRDYHTHKGPNTVPPHGAPGEGPADEVSAGESRPGASKRPRRGQAPEMEQHGEGDEDADQD